MTLFQRRITTHRHHQQHGSSTPAQGTYITALPVQRAATPNLAPLPLEFTPSSLADGVPTATTTLSRLTHLPRIGSAAPVHEPIEVALRRAEAARRSISALAMRSNLDVRQRLEAIEHHEKTNDDSYAMMHQPIKESNDDGPIPQDLFAAFQEAARQRALPKKDTKRKSLVERSASIAQQALSKSKEEVRSKVENLRTNVVARSIFFVDVRRKRAAMLEERREKGMEVLNRNAHIARCSTPQNLQDQLERYCAERDAHIEYVQLRKRQVLAERQTLREEMVKRTNRTGLEFGDVEEIKREKEMESLAFSWANIIMLGSRSLFLLEGIFERRRRELDYLTELEARKEGFLLRYKEVLYIQQWWKRLKKRKLIRAKCRAAEVIKSYLSCVPKIQSQFRMAVRRTLNRVVAIQRHFRAIQVVRMRRRDEAVRLIDSIIRKSLQQLDVDISRIQKEKKHNESQAQAAIKARKPIFEAQVNACTTKILDLTKRKFLLTTLTEKSKREVVEEILCGRERVYRGMLLEYGKRVLDKYMIEFNAEKVLQARQVEYDEAITHVSVTALKVVTIWQLKRQAALIEAKRPVMCLGVTEEDIVRGLQEPNGELIRKAHKDFMASNEAQYASKR